jgi:hypothetical protein
MLLSYMILFRHRKVGNTKLGEVYIRLIFQKKTMERLLKKQESKAGKSSSRSRSARKQVPRVTYRNTVDGISISLPPSLEFPLQSQTVVG